MCNSPPLADDSTWMQGHGACDSMHVSVQCSQLQNGAVLGHRLWQHPQACAALDTYSMLPVCHTTKP
jgi:hypothetical protein